MEICISRTGGCVKLGKISLLKTCKYAMLRVRQNSRMRAN